MNLLVTHLNKPSTLKIYISQTLLRIIIDAEKELFDCTQGGVSFFEQPLQIPFKVASLLACLKKCYVVGWVMAKEASSQVLIHQEAKDEVRSWFSHSCYFPKSLLSWNVDPGIYPACAICMFEVEWNEQLCIFNVKRVRRVPIAWAFLCSRRTIVLFCSHLALSPNNVYNYFQVLRLFRKNSVDI